MPGKMAKSEKWRRRRILDRAVGKAPQAMVHSGAIGSYDLTKATDDELNALITILSGLETSGGN